MRVFAGSGSRAGWAGSVALSSVSRVGRSGERRERADAAQGAGVVLMPGPAGGEMQRPAACVARQAARNREQAAAQGAGRADGRVGQAEQLCPPEEVVLLARLRRGHRRHLRW